GRVRRGRGAGRRRARRDGDIERPPGGDHAPSESRVMSDQVPLEAASRPPVALDRIGQIAIPVADVERAVAFYRDVLGMRFLFSAPPGLAFFDCGGIRLMLDAAAPSGPERHSSIIYYQVGD